MYGGRIATVFKLNCKRDQVFLNLGKYNLIASENMQLKMFNWEFKVCYKHASLPVKRN